MYKNIFVILVVISSLNKEKPLLTILENGLGESDLTDAVNFAIMKSYVIRCLVGVKLPHPELISCKDHRVRTLI